VKARENKHLSQANKHELTPCFAPPALPDAVVDVKSYISEARNLKTSIIEGLDAIQNERSPKKIRRCEKAVQKRTTFWRYYGK
jgi:hypothetical protein